MWGKEREEMEREGKERGEGEGGDGEQEKVVQDYWNEVLSIECKCEYAM